MSEICTLEEYKNYIGLDGAEPHKNDVQNQFMLDGMEAAVLGYIDVAVSETVLTNQIIDGKIEDMITPGNFPIISVQQVVFDVESDGTGGTVVDPEHYHHDEVSIFLRDGYFTNRGRGMIRLDYTHGYSSVPSDIKLAILQATKIFSQYKSSDAEHVGGSRSKKDESESIGGTSNGVWNKSSGLPNQVEGMLQKYRFLGYDNMGYAQRTR